MAKSLPRKVKDGFAHFGLFLCNFSLRTDTKLKVQFLKWRCTQIKKLKKTNQLWNSILHMNNSICKRFWAKYVLTSILVVPYFWYDSRKGVASAWTQDPIAVERPVVNAQFLGRTYSRCASQTVVPCPIVAVGPTRFHSRCASHTRSQKGWLQTIVPCLKVEVNLRPLMHNNNPQSHGKPTVFWGNGQHLGMEMKTGNMQFQPDPRYPSRRYLRFRCWCW